MTEQKRAGARTTAGLTPQEPKESSDAAKGLADWVENLSAPEVFADGAYWFSLGPGYVTCTFGRFRWDNSVSPGVRRLVNIGRLVMPISGAQQLALGLYDYLKKNGLDPAQKPDDPQQVQ